MKALEFGQRRALGAGFILTAALVMLAMGHHPSGAHGVGGINQVVHVGMITLLSLQFVFLVVFLLGLRVTGLFVLIAIWSLALSALAHIVAALFSGFITPTLVGAAHGALANHDVLRLAVGVNQTFAKLGVFATGVGFASVGLQLLMERDKWAKVLGAMAISSGLAPVAFLLMNSGVLDVSKAMFAYGLHMAWIAALGIMLISGKGTSAFK